MKKVTLMFENQIDLEKFEMLTDFNHKEINLRKHTIAMEWNEAKIELAINAFNATVFKVDEV